MKHSIKITAYVLSLLTALGFSACDDGGGDKQDSGFSAGDKITLSADEISFGMVYVPGGLSLPTMIDELGGTATVPHAYWIGETEVTYQVWNTVYGWAVNGTGSAPGEGEYHFAHPGTMGDGSGDTAQHPVTQINWREAMAWCNALTEWYNDMNGTSYACAYYADQWHSYPVRDASSTDDVADPPLPGTLDEPYLKIDADGFRLLFFYEWELAARYIDDANNDGDITDDGEYYPGNFASGADAVYNVTSGASDYDGDGDIEYSTDVGVFDTLSTAAVKSKSPNALGVYDMGGNVWEFCFDWASNHEGSSRSLRGGAWQAAEQMYWQLDYYVMNVPNAVLNSTGFRIARTAD